MRAMSAVFVVRKINHSVYQALFNKNGIVCGVSKCVTDFSSVESAMHFETRLVIIDLQLDDDKSYAWLISSRRQNLLTLKTVFRNNNWQ